MKNNFLSAFKQQIHAITEIDNFIQQLVKKRTQRYNNTRARKR